MIKKWPNNLIILSVCFLANMIAVTANASNSVSACTGLSDFDNDGDRGRNHVINLIADAFLDGGSENGDPQFQKLDSIINELLSLNCRLTDGRQKINFISFGFRSAFKHTFNWDRSYKKIQALRKARPKSAYAIYAESVYWIQYAWNARGSGFASTVPPEMWRRFRERLTTAEKILSDNKEIGASFPGWYGQMVNIKGGLGKIEERDKVFYEGATRYKDYLPLYIVMRNYSEPKWGGSWKKVDDFISWASDNADISNKSFMYARLYYGVRENMISGKSFFKDTLVDWVKLKAAYQELIQQYPDSLDNLAIFADLSCEANDKDTYIKLRKMIGDDIHTVTWGGHEPPAVCDLKFGYTQ